jgi:hypothetical protein
MSSDPSALLTAGGEPRSLDTRKENDLAKAPANHGKDWTGGDNKELRQLIKENTPTRVMGLKLGRTPGAVQQHANELGLSTKPTNQSPYNRKKK